MKSVIYLKERDKFMSWFMSSKMIPWLQNNCILILTWWKLPLTAEKDYSIIRKKKVAVTQNAKRKGKKVFHYSESNSDNTWSIYISFPVISKVAYPWLSIRYTIKNPARFNLFGLKYNNIFGRLFMVELV